MRFIHTADWHLGRVYHGLSLLEEQAHLLDQLVELVRDKKPELLLIAGDIYDRSVPPAEAVRLLDDTLTRLVNGEKVRVVLIAGNHDGPDRLGFGSRLLADAGLVVRGLPGSAVDPVVLSDEHGQVAFYPLPYAEPCLVRQLFSRDDIGDHNDGLSVQMDALRACHVPGRRAVVLAHAFVQGGTVSESERELSVGGSSLVDAKVFAGMNYVALGHLHRPQSIGEPHIHYAGSLMKYSFNEADQPKSVSIVELDATGQASIERVSLRPRRDLRIVEGSLQELIVAGASDPARDDYVLARLTDSGALLDAMGKLRMVYPNALAIERIVFASRMDGMQPGRDHRRVSMKDLFCGFYEEMTGNALDEESMALLVAEISAMQQSAREVQS